MSSQADRWRVNQGIVNADSGTMNFNAPVEFKYATEPGPGAAGQRHGQGPPNGGIWS